MVNDTQAKHFFAHASSLTPDCFMFTDSQTPEWAGDEDDDSDFDFDKMVELTSKTNLVSRDNKRKAFYKPCDKCENIPVCYEGGETSHDWCLCNK